MPETNLSTSAEEAASTSSKDSSNQTVNLRQKSHINKQKPVLFDPSITSLRETTPPHNFRYSSPATPNTTHFDELYMGHPPNPPLTPARLPHSRLLEQYLDLHDDDDRIKMLTELLSVSSRYVLSEVNKFISPLLKKDPFQSLPNEISLRIISFIDDPRTLARASQVSRLWYLLLSDDLTWKELCKSHHYRRLSAAVSLAPRSQSLDSDSSVFTTPNNQLSTVQGAGMEDLAEAIYNPEATRRPVPTSYRTHFKHQYMLNTAWTSGGKLAARYVISNSGVVTSLIMTGGYIVFALDNSKIFVFREDGKLLRSLFGHVMGVWALTLWGDTLVSGGCDRDVRVWNLKTGECLQILRGHSSTVRCLQMANETTAVSGSRDNTIRIWDISKGTCEHTLTGHRSSVRCIEVKGDICVSGSYDFTAKVWRISDGTLLHTLNGHFSQIYSLAFDGSRVATGSLDASIRVWDVNTGTLLSILQGHTSLVGQLQIRDNILVSGGSDGALRVWDLDEYRCIHRLAAHDNSVTSLQFDEHRIVSGGSDGKVRVWDLKEGRHVRDLAARGLESVWRVAFRDEKVVVLASKAEKILMELTSFSPSEDDNLFNDAVSRLGVLSETESVQNSTVSSPARDIDPMEIT